MKKVRYKVGELASSAGLTVRTIRYYDELGLLKTHQRTEGGQRIYSSEDLVYLKRISELKNLGFSLEEIGRIIRLGSEDRSGELRREMLLKQYRGKLQDGEAHVQALERQLDELRWHIAQLENASDGFQECPGALCATCRFLDKCTIAEKAE